MTIVRAVGFDLDGTLFDHRRSALNAVDAFLVDLGVSPSPTTRSAWLRAEESQYERWRAGEISFQEQRRERLRTVLPTYGLTTPTEPAALDALFDRYLLEYRRSWSFFPDSISVLATLRSAGFRVGLLTDGSGEQQREKLTAAGLLDSFDAVCISEELGVQKPDPIAFTTLAGRLGVTPAECLFIGDNLEHDIHGAENAGMHALLVDRYGEHAGGIARDVLERISQDATLPRRA